MIILELAMTVMKESKLCFVQAPILVGGVFGVYLLALLIHGVLSFKNCPEDAAELQKALLPPYF